MKKFTLKFVLFMLPLVLIFSVLEICIDDSMLYRVSRVYKKTFDFKQNKAGIKVLVLGSSHADNAVNESLFPCIANLANQGQDLKYDWFVYQLIEDAENIKVLVISLSYFSFNYSEDKIWPFRVRDYLDMNSVFPEKNPLRFKSWVYDNWDLINYNLPVSRIIREILKSAKKEKSRGKQEKQWNSTDLVHDARTRAIPTHYRYFNTDYAVNEKYIYNIYNKCIKNNVVPVIVISPLSSHYYYNFSLDKRKMFYRNLKKLSAKLDIRVFDYSTDPRFFKKDDYFLNSDHLNSHGAEIFTGILMADINLFFKKQKIKAIKIYRKK